MRPRNLLRLRPFLALAVLAAFVVPAYAEDAKKDEGSKEASKADVTGTWKWSFAMQDGQKRESTAKLKQEGEKVTGTVSGRQGAETEIKDGKIDAEGKLTFSVSREFNGNTMTMMYSGQVDRDTIKGKIETKRPDGQTREREWEAKREKEGASKEEGEKKDDGSGSGEKKAGAGSN